MKFIIGVISIFNLILVPAWLFNIGFNLTPSLPRGIYMTVNEDPKHNDIVNFCLEDNYFISVSRNTGYVGNGLCKSNLQPLLKRVAGMAGDTVSIQDDGIYVTRKNKNIACVWDLPKKFDSKGRPMISVLESGVIPKNKMLVLTTHKGSFDSRYFGLIDSNTASKTIPLFTF